MTKSDDLRPPDAIFFAFPAEVKASLRPEDRFLVSYPRSGNTWVRYMLAAGCALQKGEDLPLSREGVARVLAIAAALVPDVHAGALPDGPDPWGGGRPGRIIKSHNVREVASHECVYLFRRPEDSLLSYAHYAGRAEGGADRFVLRQVRTWAAEAAFALECHRRAPARFFPMSYERLLERPSEGLRLVAGRLGLRIDAPNRERAVALNDFRRLQALERVGDEPALAPGAKFFRRGGSGAGDRELRPGTLALVREHAGPVYERLREAADAIWDCADGESP